MIKLLVSIGQVILGLLKTTQSFFFFFNVNRCFLNRVVAVGSADMTTQVFSVPLLDKLHRFTLAGHGREIVAAFFEQDSLNVNEEKNPHPLPQNIVFRMNF